MDKPAASLCAIAAVLLLGSAATAADKGEGAPFAPLPDSQGSFDSLMREVARFRAYPRFDRAYALLRGGQHDREALAELESGLKHEPGNMAARLAMVDVLTRLGRRAQALEQVGIALAQQAGHAGALRRRAVLLFDEGRTEESAPVLRTLLAHPAATAEDRTLATTLLARISAPTAQEAGGAPRLVLEVPAWMELVDSAKANDAAGRWREALADYRRAMKLTGDVDTRLNLLSAQAAIARRHNDLEALRDCLVQAAALAPRNMPVVRELVSLAQRNQDAAELQTWMLRLAALSRTAGDHEYLANLHYASGQAAAAADAYRQALARTRNSGVQHRLQMALGHALFGLEDHAGAAAAFQTAATLRATPEALQAASQALYRSGDRLGAIDALRTLVRHHPGPAHRLRLAALLGEDEQDAEALTQAGLALEAASDTATRMQALRRLALLRTRQGDAAGLRAALTEIVRATPNDQRALLALAQACADMGDDAEAAGHFERSARLRPSEQAFRGLIAARTRLQDGPGSISAYRGLLSLPGLEPAAMVRAQAGLADLLMAQGQHADAARAYRAALDAGPDAPGLNPPALNLGLGYALAAQQRPAEALAQFELAYRAEPRSVVALQLARTHIALQHTEEAIRYGEAALSGASGLTAEQHRVLLQEMATLHSGAGRTQQAAALRAQALESAPEPQAAMALARAQLADQQWQAAQRTLDAWPVREWSAALAAEHLDLGSQVKAREGRRPEARSMLAQAQQLEPKVDRRYRLALLDLQLGQTQAGLSAMDDLMRSHPEGRYREAAAQALYDAGQFAGAAELYGQAVADEPNRVDLLRSQAYALMRAGRNDDAAAAFRKAIDVVRRNGSKLSAAPADLAPTRTDVDPPEPALAALQSDADAKELELWRMRQEVRKLNKNFDFSLYESYRGNTGTTAQSGAGAVSGNGVVPSQGGVEAAWRPPGIGLRDDRTLHVFGRMTWSHRPGSLSIDGDTAQGSIGARYKPLSTQQFYVGAERLLKSGRATQTDWLLRASYGWTDGLGIDDPRQTQWNYSSFYADVGRFTGQRLNASYVEARQGRTWKVGEQLLLSPHVVLAARHQRPDPDRTSYSEAGAGVSLRGFFNATEYEAPRHSAELVVQYKHGFKRVGSGWSATAILAF